ncbi:MAG TPA: methyltransferase domain-containing protein [Candidatus Angelobacter sp.]|jgi:ubiquinone/menaquinone biosynthesis C-methylase UbiE
MSDNDSVFAGSIPAIYQQYLEPMFFEPYAADLAERLQNISSGRILEIAAGTGVVTRALARAVSENVSIIATDLNQPMLDFAASRFAAGRITWQQADAQALPFADDCFDAAACQFGVMFFPDKVAAYREARRVLKPGGQFIFNVWDRIDENEIALMATDALATLIPDNPPRFMARTPHGYHDRERVLQDLRMAGFSEVSLETKRLESRSSSARDAAIALCQGTPLRNEIEERIPGRLAEATEAVQNRIATLLGEGPIQASMQAHIVVAGK